MKSIQELEAVLAAPSDVLIRDMMKLDGDILLLGVGGKMGPSMAELAINAIRASGVTKTVYGASRFSTPGLKDQLEEIGMKTINVDLLNDAELQSLPDVKNVIFMAGTKFGTTGNEHFTWAMNAYLPVIFPTSMLYRWSSTG